ncbi:MAG: GAF domain-containing protein, partial [Anaerolineales bacterium]|nr:GAF domain-containing protein [Anaerolineales bacterium]
MARLTLTDPNNPELAATIARFEQTLAALTYGGEVVDGNSRSLTLSPNASPAIQSHLSEITNQWLAFQTQLQPPIDDALLQADFAALLSQLDSAVSAYEAEAQAKIARLRWVQIIFLVVALLLLAWGYHLVHDQLIRPLAALGTVAQGIGTGKLNAAVPVLPGYELNQLGQTMERMRGEIAVYQTSLEQKVALRTQELTTAFNFSQEIVQELDPAHLMQSVADHTCDLMQGAGVAVCALDGDGRALELVAGSGPGQQYVGLRQSATRGIALPVIQQHETVVAEGGCANCGFLHHFPGDSCTAAPLQIGNRTLGALCVVRPQNPFDADEARVLTLLANAAAIALENARLIEAGKQQTEENASLAERERLAVDLHDNLAQTLGAMHLSVDQLARELAAGETEQAEMRVAEMQTNVQQAYAQVRMALTGLQESTP